MRVLSYRNKRRAKQFLVALAVVLALLLAFCLIRFIYLQRFLVYEDGNVRLDYQQNLTSEEAPRPSWEGGTIEIITEEAAMQETDPMEAPLQVLSGCYISTRMLADLDSVYAALSEMDSMPQTVMLELKSVYGNFYYPSGISGASAATAADVHAVDAFIDELASRSDVYLIARIASLSDPHFALANQSCGLPLRSGALWVDENNCYWLDPMKDLVQQYLMTIAQELASMGFDEVVFDGFWIPDSGNIVYRSELTREEAAAQAAANLCELLADTPIRVSFNSSNPQVADHSVRVYLATEDGAQVAELVEGVQGNMDNPAAQIVFLTPSRDTRFEGYGMLRPLIEYRTE